MQPKGKWKSRKMQMRRSSTSSEKSLTFSKHLPRTTVLITAYVFVGCTVSLNSADLFSEYNEWWMYQFWNLIKCRVWSLRRTLTRTRITQMYRIKGRNYILHTTQQTATWLICIYLLLVSLKWVVRHRSDVKYLFFPHWFTWRRLDVATPGH